MGTKSRAMPAFEVFEKTIEVTLGSLTECVRPGATGLRTWHRIF
jgi:hypothetical protein